MTLRILIVEDEPMVAKRLARLLGSALDRPPAVLDMAVSLDAAREMLAKTPYDALFLDLSLRGRDGFELLAGAVAEAPQTVVVSANADRALEAFDYGVIDFVAKPFDAERIAKAVSRLKAARMPAQHRARFLAFRRAGGTELVEITRIRAIHGADNYAEVELVDGRRLLHDKTLEQLEKLLPDTFQRIHRSHIVNMRCIERLRSLPGSRYRTLMDSGEELPVSRGRVKALRSRLVWG